MRLVRPHSFGISIDARNSYLYKYSEAEMHISQWKRTTDLW